MKATKEQTCNENLSANKIRALTSKIKILRVDQHQVRARKKGSVVCVVLLIPGDLILLLITS